MNVTPHPNPPSQGGRGQAAGLTVVAATRLEAWAARMALPRGISIERVGVGLRGWTPISPRSFVSCGLAGSLSASIRPGTIVVPDWVGLPSGERIPCRRTAVERLAEAARADGFPVVVGPLITVPRVVTGRERAAWAERGFVAADMETGLLLRWCEQGAAARVILDSPDYELPDVWAVPRWRALRPETCVRSFQIATAAPVYAVRAARVVAAAAPFLVKREP